MSKYMGQIMAECDCQHQACEMRGYCMAARIEQLEANALANRVAIMRLEAKLAKAVGALGGMVGLFSGYSLLLKGMHLKIVLYNARAALAELKGKE